MSASSNSAGTPIGISALSGDCVSGQDARFKRTGLLANAYIDLGTWAGVTPYVGAGAGVTYAKVDGVYDWYTGNNGAAYAPNIPYPTGFPPVWVTGAGTPTTAPAGFTFGQQSRRVDVSRSQTKFTWALMAGLTLDVAANTKIDLGYRFVNMGSLLRRRPPRATARSTNTAWASATCWTRAAPGRGPGRPPIRLDAGAVEA